VFHLSAASRSRLWRVLGRLALLLFVGFLSLFLGTYLWAYHHLRAARTSLEQGHNLVAIEHLQSCRGLLGDRPEWLILSAHAARCSGDWTEAELLLDQYGKLRGDDDDLVLERLLLSATRGEIEAVRPQLKVHIDANDPAAPLAREALIVGYIYRFRLFEANEEVEHWLEREPDRPTALYLQGKLFEMREVTSSALLAYRRCLEVDPEYDESRLRLAGLLLANRESEEALPHLEYLNHRYPDNSEILVKQAQALDLQRRGGEARAVLDACLARHPNDADSLAERGRMARRDGDTVAAEDDLRKAVALDPGNFVARYQFSLALKESGKSEEALKEQETITRMEADGARLKEIIDGLLARNPNDPALYHEIGMISLRAGKPREALRWLNNSLAADPNYEPTHRALSSFYHETGNPILSARHRALAQQLADRKKQ
jgi:tetratricopeptide (TPR) repeat protein